MQFTWHTLAVELHVAGTRYLATWQHVIGLCWGCREARRAALQANLVETEAAERAGHNYKANPVPAHIHHPSMTALPEPSFTVSLAHL